MSTSSPDRRSFLARLVSAGMGLVGAGLAGLAGLVVVPKSRASERRWKRAASMFDLPPDAPLAATIAERQPDGWYETRKQTVVFIDRDGDGYRALSATCTHLGCRVRWDAPKKQYLCPCHGGVYDRAGNVVSGPPPQGLAPLSVRVNPKTADLEVEL